MQGIKNKKRIGLGEKEVYENPKLYIRQSAKEIIASLDLDRSAANNSLYAVSFRKNDIKSVKILKIILGQLNSKIITFLAQKKRIIRYSRGKQPQIKISDLLNIPIIADDEMTEKIFNYVNNYLSTENHLIYVNKIDDCIYNYYGINIEEREYIEKEVKNF